MAGSSFAASLVSHQHALHSIQPERAEILAHPLLTGAQLPSAAHLQEEVVALQESEAAAQEQVEYRQQALEQSILALSQALDRRRQELNQLPEEIEAIEDSLGDLCTELQAGDSSEGAGGSNLVNGASSLNKELEGQHALLAQLESARDYLSVLAKAEALRQQAIEAEQARNGEGALQLLSELSLLTKQVTSLLAGDGPSKASVFVRSQCTAAFAALVKAREERLKEALAEAGWPPPPAELQDMQRDLKQSPSHILLTSPAIRHSWREMLVLQHKGETLGLIAPSTSRSRRSKEESGREAIGNTNLGIAGAVSSAGPSNPAPGSSKYQPLLAIQTLLQPLLLRFYYHFDSERSTNRLDKPEWYLAHMLSLIRAYASLFQPSTGAIAILCNNSSKSRPGRLRYDLYAELLHGILRPLSLKVESSIPLLLQNSQLLSHTIMQAVQFDQDIRSMIMPIDSRLAPIYLADALLSNETVFEAWVQSERVFATDRLNEELESGKAWLVGDEEGVDDGASEGSWTAMAQESGLNDESSDAQGSSRIKTTRSARAVISLVDGLTARYSALPSVSNQLPFLLIQLSVLQNYAQRLERSLDAFESLSSAFSRAIPGAISGTGSSGGGGDASQNGEGDMVRGLRGLGRLLKACLSALYVRTHLQSLSSQSFFLLMGASLANTPEGAKLMGDFRKWEGDEEERELDQASLGELVRRGWRTGGRIASGMRPLGAATSAAARAISPNRAAITATSAKTEKDVEVWEKLQERYSALAHRAQYAIERLVVSEVLEGLRTYAQRDWNEDEAEDDDEDDDGPTATLLPGLSTLSTHLLHLIPSLPRAEANAVYRRLSESLSTTIVERVVFSGGSHRFSEQGGIHFARDVRQGWMGVVMDIAGRVAVSAAAAGPMTSSAMGQRPQAPWSYLLDAAMLLSLTDPDPDDSKDKNIGVDEVQLSEKPPTFQQACRAAFEPTIAGPSWEEVQSMLGLDDRLGLRIASEILRRRIECPW